MLLVAVFAVLCIFEFATSPNQDGLLPFYWVFGCFASMALSMWFSKNPDVEAAVFATILTVIVGLGTILMKLKPNAFATFKDGF